MAKWFEYIPSYQMGKAAWNAGKSITQGPPKPPDFMEAMRQSTALNRPDQRTPTASSTWEQTEEFDAPPSSGSVSDYLAWAARQKQKAQNKTQVVKMDPALDPAMAGLKQQAGQYGQAMDWSQFGDIGSGEDARQQAIDASYEQSMRRINPAFAQRESATQTQLLNQGLDPNSEAGRAARAELATQRLDATQGAMNSAIMAGNQAGNDIFRNNMLRRQQMVAEALKQRGQPLEEMRGFMGLTQMPQFYQTPGPFGAMQAQYGADQNYHNAQQRQAWDLINGGTQLATTVGPMLA
jgi:hypothetical protein